MSLRFLCLAHMALTLASASADWTTVWTVGTDNDSQAEFISEWQTDDDYTVGEPLQTVPDPDNLPATMQVIPLERAVSADNPFTRIHFPLTTAQRSANARMRFTIKVIDPGWWDSINEISMGTGWHDVSCTLNGVAVGLFPRITRDQMLTFELRENAVSTNATDNVLTITRTGGSPTASWVQFDFLSLAIDELAYTDADADGLPAFWEKDNGLSDAAAGQGSLDPDHDGLSNLQEYALGTNPSDADSDDDGLLDGTETSSSPLLTDTDADGLTDLQEITALPATNPQAPDTDSDGASDAWEWHMHTNATLNSSVPPAFTQAVGVNFVSAWHNDGWLRPRDITGVVPQQYWNNTRPLGPWGTVNAATSAVLSPTTGQVVNATGANSNFAVSWTANGVWASGNQGSAAGRLLDGFLLGQDGVPASVTLTGINFATYDVYVYVGSSANQQRGWARLGTNDSTKRYFLSANLAPQTSYIEAITTTADLAAAIGTETNAQEIERRKTSATRQGNYVRFRNVTGASVNVQAQSDIAGTGAGIFAVQVVDVTADRDTDGMPDSYEFANGLKPSVADATLDADGDGLTNLQEFTRGSNPTKQDTDEDGLNDNFESAANALTPDSDRDGLSDAAEAAAIRPTNANAADSDGDGVSDLIESQLGTDPLASSSTTIPVPTYTASPRSWNWQIDTQLVWDHGPGSPNNNPWGDNTFLGLFVSNTAVPGDYALGNALRYVNGRLSWLFVTRHGGAFSVGGSPGNSLWVADWGAAPPDLTALLGFSGYGHQDVSGRLRFSFAATRGASINQWNYTFQILNLDRAVGSQVVASYTQSNATAAASTENGTAQWYNNIDLTQRRALVELRPGVKAYFGYPALETLSSFVNAKDADDDGMPDYFEDAHGFNKNSAADATLDFDADGLSNRDEFLLNAFPKNADSDGDGVRDGLEIQQHSNPRLASSTPAYLTVPPPLAEDFNGNGLPDAWEMWSGNFALAGNQDNDGDGMTNVNESLAGTNPFDPNSRLWVECQSVGATAVVTWPAVAHKSHKLWQTANLTQWTAAPGAATQAGNVMTQTVSTVGTNRDFFRAAVGNLDSDGDGISDWSEALIGSNPLIASSMRTAVPQDLNSDGVLETPLAGDYAAWAEQLQGGQSAGGYTGTVGGSISRTQAARFLTQSTFGPTMEDIDALRAIGYQPWLDQQRAAAPTLHQRYIKQIYEDFLGARVDQTYSRNTMDNFINDHNVLTPFFRSAVGGSDQLRQRMAFALSQIMVISRRDAGLQSRPLAVANFYDIFVRHGLGNYLDVLTEVALHPCMGRYLSHLGNQKANPALNQYPDENFAREIMQLFTIGLWQLNADGTRQIDVSQQSIPTYGNEQITQMARVFTGLWVGGQDWLDGGWQDASYAVPMEMHADRHDFGTKTLLQGFVIPPRAASQENAMRDVKDAVKHLFDHPNTPPFVSRQLIQFLVTSNPSPAYIQRVQNVFVNNGVGIRGDLAAVARAILLDEEARSPAYSHGKTSFGKLKEPVIRAMHLARLGGLGKNPQTLWWNWGSFRDAAFQEPTYAPSVFNFYRPDYKAPGILTQRQLNAPVFQITDSYSSISFPNLLWDIIQTGFSEWQSYSFPLDFSGEMQLANTPEALADRVNLLLCNGHMSAASRTQIVAAINAISSAEPAVRAKLAVYLAATCPEGAVQR
jgi:uncharacterized protein (DUF1800 family)